LEGESFLISNYRFDTKTIAGFKLIGPKPYDLAQFTSAAPFAYMPGTTGDLAFVQGPSESVNNLYVTINGSDKSLYTHPGISSPTWSPDGKSVVYVGMDNNFHTQFLYKISKDGGKSDRFFPTNAADIQNRSGETFRGVTWGKTHLLFVSNLTGQYEIWRLNADGNGPLQLTNDKRENGAPAWNPTGTQFAYYSKMADNSYQIMVANADGSNKRQLTKVGNNFSPTWSPDGNWLAFSTDRGGRGFTEIWIVDKNGNNAQSITDKLNNKALTPGSWR
jgi:Tol biopolymer transport system component